MPIFEYHCAKCDKEFEMIVFRDEKITCPTCNGKKVKKLLSAFSHKSSGQFSSSKGSACTSCSATTCSTCSH